MLTRKLRTPCPVTASCWVSSCLLLTVLRTLAVFRGSLTVEMLQRPKYPKKSHITVLEAGKITKYPVTVWQRLIEHVQIFRV